MPGQHMSIRQRSGWSATATSISPSLLIGLSAIEIDQPTNTNVGTALNDVSGSALSAMPRQDSVWKCALT